MEEGGKEKWAIKKSRALQLIQEKLKVNVMFYDDEKTNIEHAKALNNLRINAFFVINTANTNESYRKIFDIYTDSILSLIH